MRMVNFKVLISSVSAPVKTDYGSPLFQSFLTPKPKVVSVARHNAHCLVLTADRSKIRPFKSMVKLLHTRNFKQPL